MKKSTFAAAALLLLPLALAACGGPSQPGDTQSAGGSGTIPTAPSDPNDPYNAYLSGDLLSINSAIQELDYKCLADNGFEDFLKVLPAQKAEEFRSMAPTPDFKSTFDSFSEIPWFPSEDYARAVGYGHSFPARAPMVFTKDPSYAQVAAECKQKSIAKISGSEKLIADYTKLGNTLSEAISVEARKQNGALSGKVYACMTKAGHQADPNGPNKTPGWNVDFGITLGQQPQPLGAPLKEGPATQVLDAVPAKIYVPTSAEADSAAAMYKCSVESGAHDEWQKAMRNAKNAALSANEAALTELNPKIKELAKSAALAVQAKA